MGKVTFGVIGTGRAYRLHRDADRGSDSVTYGAVYSRSFENARKAAAEDGKMTAYASLEKMLQSDIDAVLVLAPPGFHEELVLQCARAGKHVLCETPMAVTVEACRRMTAACRDTGVKFMIAENHRFLPAHVSMRDIIQQGLIGDVLMVRAYEGGNEMPGLPDPQSGKGNPAVAGGGAFMDMAVHSFAALEYILGSPCVRVTARMAKQAGSLPGTLEDTGAAIAHYGSGALADIMVSSSQRTLPYNSMEVFGTRGSILENHDWQRPVRFCSFDERMGENQQKWMEPEINQGPFPEWYSRSLRTTDEYFARCIIEDKAPEFTPEAAKNAVACVTAGYLSMIKNRPVETAEIEKIADEGGSMNILTALAALIPIRGGAEAASTGVSR
jgi:predicted dehydrogenase